MAISFIKINLIKVSIIVNNLHDLTKSTKAEHKIFFRPKSPIFAVSYFIIQLLLPFLFVNSAAALAADSQWAQKLNWQWERYELAQQTLLQQVQKNKDSQKVQSILRSDWESILQLPAEKSFTQQDLIDLQRDQDERIQNAKRLSKQNSKLDFDIIRKKQLAPIFCEKVPKGGMLHIHPSGTLDRTTASQLLRANNPMMNFTELLQEIEHSGGNVVLSSEEKSWLGSLNAQANYLSLSTSDQNTFTNYLFLPAGKQSFPRFNAVFYFLDYAIPDWNSYQKALIQFASKAKSQGVIYIEFTTGTGPNLFSHLEAIEKISGVKIRANHSFQRTLELE